MQRCSYLRQSIWLAVIATAHVAAQEPTAPKLSLAEQEVFLRTARIVQVRSIPVGITHTSRATLTDGKTTHDAHIQTVDESKLQFSGARSSELNFRDSFKYNIAGYKLARMLGLEGMVPVSVERKVKGSSAAVTWWVDDVEMDEGKRMKERVEPPNRDDWNDQMHIVRVFDQLIYNTDRNLGNLLITRDWKIWMIDHTRAFRLMRSLREPKNLMRCDRQFLARLKQLNEDDLRREMKGYLTTEEIKGLLARRDIIVKHFEGTGESALYTSARGAS